MEVEIAVLAGLCSALIVVFLQQAALKHSLKKDAEALRGELTALREQIRKDAASHNATVKALTSHYDEKIENYDATVARWSKLAKMYDEQLEMERRVSQLESHYPPGADPGN